MKNRTPICNTSGGRVLRLVRISVLAMVTGVVALLAVSGGCWLNSSDPLRVGQTTFVSADLTGDMGSTGIMFGAMASLDVSTDEFLADGAPTDPVRQIEEADIVKRHGDYLYVLNSYRGLKIIDLSDMSNPRLLGSLAIVGRPEEMYVEGPNAYIVATKPFSCQNNSGGGVLTVIDISEPGAPVRLTEFEFDGYVTASRRVGEVIYLVGYANQMVPGLLQEVQSNNLASIMPTENQGFVAWITHWNP